MANASRLIDICAQCGLYQRGARSPNMQPSGAKRPALYIVGMNPGKEEDDPRNDRQFVGRSGKVLRQALKDMGANMKAIMFDNITRCNAPDNKPGKQAIQICSQQALSNIRILKPRCVLILGSDACAGFWHQESIPGVTMIRGRQIPFFLGEGEFTTCVVTYHPSYILRGVSDEHEHAWTSDLALAIDIAAGEESNVGIAGKARALEEPREIHHLLKWDQVATFFPKLIEQPVVAFDWETTAISPFAPKYSTPEVPPQLYSAAWAFNDGTVYALPLYEHWPRQHRKLIHDALVKWFTKAAPNQIRIAHNLLFELLWACVQVTRCEAYELVGHYHDTQIMSWILDERTKTTSLKVAAWLTLGAEDWSSNINRAKIWRNSKKDNLEYNALDAWHTLCLFRVYSKLIRESERHRRVYEHVMHPGLWHYLDITYRGLHIDEEIRSRLGERMTEELATVTDQIRSTVGLDDFNPASPEQLSRYFEHDCRYEMLRRTKKGWSTDDETLSYLIAKYADPVAKYVQRMRNLAKLNATYVAGLDKHIATDGRIHPSQAMHLTVTGRGAASGPNNRNFPVREDPWVREEVTADKGCRLVTFDFGQLEARLFAVITGDKAFHTALMQGEDIHLAASAYMISLIQREPDPELAKKIRTPMKNVNFGAFYGAGPPKLRTQLPEFEEDCFRKLKEWLWRRFPDVLAWQKEVHERYWAEGQIVSLFGRSRRAPITYTERLNFNNQSSASDMTITSMKVLGSNFRLAWEIYDDLTFMIPDTDEAESELIEYTVATMLSVPWWYMHTSDWCRRWTPMAVEAKHGHNWYEMEEIGTFDSTTIGLNGLNDTLALAEEILRENDMLDSAVVWDPE